MDNRCTAIIVLGAVTMEKARSVIICISIIMIISVIKDADSSGQIQIRLISYEDMYGTDINGTCCDNFEVSKGVCEPCDHFIFVCLLDARDHGKGPCVSNNITTAPVYDTNSITFGTTPGTETNPFTLYFNLPSRFLVLYFSVYDDDQYDHPPSESDLLQNMTYVLFTLAPQSFSSSPSFMNGSLPNNHSSLLFEYALQCDEDFYYKCDRHCPYDPVRYSCNSHGRRLCNPGWEGINCTTYNYCWNQTCMHGGTCINGPYASSCSCLTKYSGALCENLITTETTTPATTILFTTKIATQSSTTPTTFTKFSSRHLVKSTKSSTRTKTSTPTITTTTASTPSVSDMNLKAESSNTESTLTTIPGGSTSTTLDVLTAQSLCQSSNRGSTTTSTEQTAVTALSSTMQLSRRGTENQSRQQVPETKEKFLKMIGIIVGAAAGFVSFIGAAIYCILRKKNRIMTNDETEQESVGQDDTETFGDRVSFHSTTSLNW